MEVNGPWLEVSGVLALDWDDRCDWLRLLEVVDAGRAPSEAADERNDIFLEEKIFFHAGKKSKRIREKKFHS